MFRWMVCYLYLQSHLSLSLVRWSLPLNYLTSVSLSRWVTRLLTTTSQPSSTTATPTDLPRPPQPWRHHSITSLPTHATSNSECTTPSLDINSNINKYQLHYSNDNNIRLHRFVFNFLILISSSYCTIILFEWECILRMGHTYPPCSSVSQGLVGRQTWSWAGGHTSKFELCPPEEGGALLSFQHWWIQRCTSSLVKETNTQHNMTL